MDAEMEGILASTVPPLQLEKLSNFRSALFKYQRQALFLFAHLFLCFGNSFHLMKFYHANVSKCFVLQVDQASEKAAAKPLDPDNK